MMAEARLAIGSFAVCTVGTQESAYEKVSSLGDFYGLDSILSPRAGLLPNI